MNPESITPGQQLFASVYLRTTLLKNRIVMAPLTRSRAFSNLPNELMAEYYTQRVSAGLIISESIAPSPNGLGYPRIAGIFTPEQISGWKKITDAVHEKGGVIFGQINHPGRVGTFENFPCPAKIVSASAISANMDVWTDHKGFVKSDVPAPLDEEGVTDAIEEFVTAAKNAIKAGFDGVEIHGANGYLLEQFLNPHVNQRNDEYGGNVEKRCRLLLQIVQRTIEAVGKDKIGVRLSPYNTFSSMPHYHEISDTYLYLARELNKMDVAYLHLIDTVTRLSQDSALHRPLNQLFEAIRWQFGGVLILNGGFTRERAERAIADNKADLISFGTLFIANPDLPYRLQHNLPLELADPATYYAGGSRGYTDYPAWSENKADASL